VKHFQVTVYHLLQSHLKFDRMMDSYIELSAVAKEDRYAGCIVIGNINFADDFSGDRAVGPPTANRLTFHADSLSVTLAIAYCEFIGYSQC
jgi:hypothetical protein